MLGLCLSTIGTPFHELRMKIPAVPMVCGCVGVRREGVSVIIQHILYDRRNSNRTNLLQGEGGGRAQGRSTYTRAYPELLSVLKAGQLSALD